MRFTISGFWTAIIIAAIMTVLLYIITKSQMIYRTINPNIIIVFAFLVIIRVLFPLEIDSAKGIFVLKIVPQIDTAVRYPVFDIFENTVRVWMILAVVWAIGAAVQIYIMIQQYTSMKKLMFFCRPLSEEKMFVVRLAEKEMGVRGKIEYLMGAKYTSPFIFGVFKSIVVLPDCIEYLPDEQVCMMIYHEMSHHIRRDCATKIILKVIACIFWWLPCMKPLMEKLDEAIEIRADWNTIKKMSEKQKTEYLKVLYSMANAGKNSKVQYANMFISGQVDTIEKRFSFISNHKKWCLTNVFMFIGLVVFLLSYVFIIEPKHLPSEGGINCNNTCTVYLQENGEYKVYFDETYLGNLKSLEFLNNPNFKNVTVNIMEGE